MAYMFQTPIEMPRGSHYGSDYWIAYSYKLKRMVRLYSMLEYANFITLEMTPTVEYFCEQPLKIESVDLSSHKRTSVFDFWVQYFDSTHEFQEIKYSSELTENTDAATRSKAQVEFQSNWCSTNGYNYRIVTEKDIYDGQFKFQNLELLHNHLLRYSQANRIELNSLQRILSENTLSIAEIKSLKILPDNYELSALAYHFYLGNISINIKDRPLDNYTEVKLCGIKNTTF